MLDRAQTPKSSHSESRLRVLVLRSVSPTRQQMIWKPLPFRVVSGMVMIMLCDQTSFRLAEMRSFEPDFTDSMSDKHEAAFNLS